MSENSMAPTLLQSMADLREALEHHAEWRFHKAEEYPEDARNRKAARIAGRLAGEIETGHYSNQLASAYHALYQARDVTYTAMEFEREAIRGLGFRTYFDSVDDLLEAITDQARIVLSDSFALRGQLGSTQESRGSTIVDFSDHEASDGTSDNRLTNVLVSKDVGCRRIAGDRKGGSA
ncbi:MAG: hypothetical protein K5872_15990 [Rhizobiaceae bacterium]|nr:hypothetical protein [Rhizobiaceae bacterium]MCV0407724.1 hypothetical protein [Rhizobiaceae bacterium]